MLSAIGVAIGGAGAYAATRLVQKQLFGILPTDALTMALSAFGIATVAILSGYLPGPPRHCHRPDARPRAEESGALCGPPKRTS